MNSTPFTLFNRLTSDIYHFVQKSKCSHHSLNPRHTPSLREPAPPLPPSTIQLIIQFVFNLNLLSSLVLFVNIYPCPQFKYLSILVKITAPPSPTPQTQYVLSQQSSKQRRWDSLPYGSPFKNNLFISCANYNHGRGVNNRNYKKR